jgi:hypothetical protein
MRNRVKYCPGCNRHLWVALPSSLEIIPAEYWKRDSTPRLVSFNRKNGPTDHLQPYCRTCDWNGKATIEEAWNRFQRELEKEPATAHLWTQEIYESILGDEPECHYCGSRCRDWGIGHWIDRITTKDVNRRERIPHLPDNAVVCCTPCNYHKGQKSADAHQRYIETLIVACPRVPNGRGIYPWTKVQWNDHPSASKFFSRVYAPDLTAHTVPDPQLLLFGGAA